MASASQITRHGTRAAYNRGCHCPKCTEALNEYARARRAEQREINELNLEEITALVFTPQEWMDEAVCRGLGQPDIFFPDRGDWVAVEIAKSYCATCPVTRECLDYALTMPYPSGRDKLPGIWGGTTQRERRTMRRQMRKESA